jgi:hypothetical protein
MNSRHLLIAAIATVVALLAGCSHVAPYQREHLAQPGMDTAGREALRNQFVAHVHDSREGAMATSDHAGGGCGCN